VRRTENRLSIQMQTLFLFTRMKAAERSVLKFKAQAEEIIGATDFSKKAFKLKNKIFSYSRIYTDKFNQENVAIYFYPKECSALTEILLFALTMNRKNTHNYFSELKKSKLNPKKK
jgi:hypothetical protein